MTTLQDRLDRIKAGFLSQVPESVTTIIDRATRNLENSGLAEDALGEGDRLPAIALPDQNGETVALAGLIARGPVVLTVFRGHW